MSSTFRPEIQRFVDEKLRSGQYESQDELVQDALMQMKQQEQLTPEHIKELRELIDVGIKQADRGEFVEFNAESIIAAGKTALQKHRQHKDG